MNPSSRKIFGPVTKRVNAIVVVDDWRQIDRSTENGNVRWLCGHDPAYRSIFAAVNWTAKCGDESIHRESKSLVDVSHIALALLHFGDELGCRLSADFPLFFANT